MDHLLKYQADKLVKLLKKYNMLKVKPKKKEIL